MRKTLITIAISLLLLLNGTGALYGGLNLLLHPDGSSMQMSLSWLRHSPFSDYLIPGLVLLVVNGLGSFFVWWALLFKWKNRAWFVVAEGILLGGWILIQLLMVQTFNLLHLIFITVALSLTLLGWWLQRMEDTSGRGKQQGRP